MGAPYDNIPGVDSTDMFHPDIRTALAQAPELLAAFAAKIHTHVLNDITMTELAQEDLDTITTTGYYHQSQNADAAAAANYPMPDAGFLKVYNFGGFIYQEYASYRASNRKFWRSKYLTTWSTWDEVQKLIVPGTTAQYWRGDKTWQTLNSTAVGLGNVNNTSDANKPVSTAQATADDVRAKGIQHKAMVASTSGSVTDAIINNIPTFTFKANRNYRIVWDFSRYATGNSDSLFYCTIGHCSTADAAASLTGITVIEGRTIGMLTAYALASTQYTGPITVLYNPGASDQTLQVKFRVQRVMGDDGLYVVGNANERAMYQIYDDGNTAV